VRKIKELKITIPAPENFEAITGKGEQAKVEGKDVKLVSPGYLKDEKIDIPEGAFGSAAEMVVFINHGWKTSRLHCIALADEIRPESAAAIKIFKDNNIKVHMATGDNDVVGKAVSEEVGLDGYFAEVLPPKSAILKELQAKSEFVAMTGDGVNNTACPDGCRDSGRFRY
jgi:Cu2+-exporting ATPase